MMALKAEMLIIFIGRPIPMLCEIYKNAFEFYIHG